MASSATIAIGVTFSDREGNRAKATCYCAVAVPQSTAWALANAIADKMLGISNGVVSKIDLTWRYTIDSPATPAADSTMERKVLLFMVNDAEEINAILIPSPDSAIFETTGAYAGIRVDLASAGAIGWSDMLALVDLRTDDNRAVGVELAAGGLML